MKKELIKLEERARTERVCINVQAIGTNGVSVLVSKGPDRVVRLASAEDLETAQIKAEVAALKAYFYIIEEEEPTFDNIVKAQPEARDKMVAAKYRIEAEKLKAEARVKAEAERAKEEKKKKPD